jgi:hypothetical protein
VLVKFIRLINLAYELHKKLLRKKEGELIPLATSAMAYQVGGGGGGD